MGERNKNNETADWFQKVAKEMQGKKQQNIEIKSAKNQRKNP